MSKLKNSHLALKTGDVVVNDIGEYAVEIVRNALGESLKMYVNLGNETYSVDYAEAVYLKNASVNDNKLVLPPQSYAIIK